MLLNSFAFEKKPITPEKQGLIWQGIKSLESSIKYSVGKDNTTETMQLMFAHAIEHFDETEGNLKGYLRRLSQTILNTTNSKEVLADMSDGNLNYAIGSADSGSEPTMVTKPPEKVTPDFAENVINTLYVEEALQQDIFDLVKEYLVDYVTLCQRLLSGDIDRFNYSVPFVKRCIELSRIYKAQFNEACVALYNSNKTVFDRFAFDGQDKADCNIENSWRETDYTIINSKKSKRILFYNKQTNEEVKDVDNEAFYVLGAKNLSESKRILRVDFFLAWLKLCDLLDSDQTNEMKLILGNDFLVKTLGGSLSLVNPALYNIYELLKTEFVTNVLHETNGRLLSVGTKSIYILWENKWPTLFQQNLAKFEKEKDRVWVEHKDVFGVEFDLFFEDVTTKLECR